MLWAQKASARTQLKSRALKLPEAEGFSRLNKWVAAHLLKALGPKVFSGWLLVLVGQAAECFGPKKLQHAHNSRDER